MRIKIVLILMMMIQSNFSYSADLSKHLFVAPKNGDASVDIIKRHQLDYSKNIAFFLDKNAGKFSAKGGLLLHNDYELPIAIVQYDGKSIRSSLGITDFDLAEKIQDYNLDLHRKRVKKGNFRNDKILWVPFIEYNFTSPIDFKKAKIENKIESKVEAKQDLPKINTVIHNKYSPRSTITLFGDRFQSIKKTSNSLKDHFFYLVSGHGGPDPGAIGYRDGNELHEHEYAYDVTLRLAKRLIESGAEVFMIVQDPNDGIRDDNYLSNASEEYLINGDTISLNQVARLRQRTDLINQLYDQNNKVGAEHLVVEIHVDSRITDKRIDIFFYHQPGSSKGEKYCNDLLNTIKDKYDKNQPGRGYSGTVTARNLFTLRNTKPVGVYIELGNIQNANDQVRIIDPNNRQAIANWLLDGIVNTFTGKK